MLRTVALTVLVAVSHAVFSQKPKVSAPKLSLKPKASAENPSGNKWCQHGHLVPSVFLVGFQKAGSSSLWDDLVQKVGLKRGCGEVGKTCTVWGKEEPLYMKKELHFFDQDERFNKGMGFYAAHFPKCTEIGEKDQALDGTPNYITDGKATALRIRNSYNASYGNKANDLHFVLIVRDPAKRMEAGCWHFMKEEMEKRGGFEKYVDQTMKEAKLWMKNTSMPWEGTNPYHGSMYGKWLQEYLEVFDGKQFSVVTLEEYVKTPQKVASFISKRIGAHQQETLQEAEHKHQREHAKMMDKTRKRLDVLFEEDQKLFSKLVKQHCMAMDCGDGLSYM